MSVTYIPEKIKFRLWAKSAGRCQYEGCNKRLWLDTLSKAEFNTAYIAHIIADKPDGPRGDLILSEKLKSEFSNLMLLCDEHHRLIDKEDVEGHPTERLQEMKKSHEQRIEILTDILPENQTHILLYGASIGKFESPLNYKDSSLAVQRSYALYPASSFPIEIGLKNSSIIDDRISYWQFEEGNLINQFNQKVIPLITSGESSSIISIFALAPQPLLIKLGSLLGDIYTVYTFQKHREPLTWVWLEDGDPINFQLIKNGFTGKDVALVLSLSANIRYHRIEEVLGADVPIWEITYDNPHNDFLRNKSHLASLRKIFRQTLNKIKAENGEDSVIHIFPAMPISACIELGRVWMPKADLPLMIYDQNSKHESEPKRKFRYALSIK